MDKRRKDTVQPRRWVMKHMRGGHSVAERTITWEEARVALKALLLQMGQDLHEVLDYDVNADLFTVLTRGEDDDKLQDTTVPGEMVGQVVLAARRLAGSNGPLKRVRDRGSMN